MKNGRTIVKVAALAAAAVYIVTGLLYVGLSDERDFGPIVIFWTTLWLIGGFAVAASGWGQAVAKGGGRVFALSVLAFLSGVALAAEAISLTFSADEFSGQNVPPLVHPLGFALTWLVFIFALIEDARALKDN